MSNLGIKLGAVAVGAVVLAGGFWLVGTTTVDPGFAGVVYNADGGLEQTTLGQGTHMIAPWKSVTEYPISTETVYLTKASTEGSKNDDSFMVSTKEGKPVSVDVMYSYHMDNKMLPEIFTKFKKADSKAIESGFIKQNIKSAIQAVTSTYGVLELYGDKRSEITNKVYQMLQDKDSEYGLSKYGIQVESFSFGEIRPDTNTMKAIQGVVDAQNRLQQLQIEKQQAEVNAQTAKITAQGQADSKLIQATGDAKSNQALQQSITPELIQLKYAEAQMIMAQKFNGQYPSTLVTGQNGNMLFQMPTAGK